MQADAAFDRQVAEPGDRVDRSVAVVAGRPHDRNGVLVDVFGHGSRIDDRRVRVHRHGPQLHTEEMTGLVERRVPGLRFHEVRVGDPTGLTGMVPVGQHGVCDRPAPPAGDQATGLAVLDGVCVEQVQCHRDDLTLELGCAGAHVALQGVHVGEEPERLVHEPVVLVVSAVHGARALSGLPRGVLLMGHLRQLGEDLGLVTALFGNGPEDLESLGVGMGTHWISW